MPSKKRFKLVAGLVLVFAMLVVAALHLPNALGVNGQVLAQAAPAAAPAGAPNSDDWRAIRNGLRGNVSIPDKQAGVLVQSGGENWRNIRNGPLSVWGGWAMFGTIALLAAFFAVRGRIRVEHGMSGRVIERFNGVERFAHWLLAISFIVLALTGLNVLYGRYVLKPLIGPDAFAAITLFGKYVHNYIAFAFMLGLVMIFVMWVRHNLPRREDLTWLAQGGGMFAAGSHPPARKFNAGQKLLYWLVVLGGVSLSLSGIALMWPFEYSLFAPTFKVLNVFGFGLPTALTPMQEVQLSQLWHGLVSLFLIALVIAHIYIGTIGMEGSFDAMGNGMVDENWAREHHSLWAAEMKKMPSGGDE
jgi:formate dehydrogenase subunit gamma